MISFKQYLAESYKNAIGNDPLKEKYAKQVWDVLQKSYHDIGGIRGSGFNSIEDMKANIPFWKMSINGGTVNAVILYKDKGGRKFVAVGTDGSAIGKAKIKDMLKAEIKRSYGEKSKSALGLVFKLYPRHVLELYMSTPSEASQVLKKEVTPIKSLPRKEWPNDAKKTLDKHPWLLQYGYIRLIAGKPTFKVLIGTKGNRIK